MSLDNLCICQNLDVYFDPSRCSRKLNDAQTLQYVPREPFPCVHFQPHHSSLPPHQSLYTRPSTAVTQTTSTLQVSWRLGSFLYSTMLIINRGYSMNVHGRKDGRKVERRQKNGRKVLFCIHQYPLFSRKILIWEWNFLFSNQPICFSKTEFFCFPINQSLSYVVCFFFLFIFFISIPSFPQDKGAPESYGVSAWEWVSQLN